LRIGRQPYGVLPAISLDRWVALEGGAIDTSIVRAVSELRAVWRRSLDAVPRIPERSDTASELVRILAMEATSRSFAARPVQPAAAVGATKTGEPMGSARLRALAQMLGITWYPRQLRSVFGRFQRLFELSGALVAVAEPLSETETLSANYLTS